MKTPEGWKLVPVEPTEEMSEAMADAYEKCSKMQIDHWLHVPDMYQAALAVAPTPPAQGHIAQVLPLPEQPEVTVTISSPDNGKTLWVSGPEKVAQLGAEAGARTKELLSPAQEDEPVASVNSIRESIGQGTINILKEGIDPGDYLYTRPSSELRKAAEDMLDVLDDPNPTGMALLNARDNLRAALERK